MHETVEKKHFWQKYPNTTLWSFIAFMMICWLWSAGEGSKQRFILLVSLALASFMVGSLAGFLLTSYGEETGTVGKVRDWLVGGITGLTIAKFGMVKAVLLTFAAGPGPAEFALAFSTATVGVTLGFFFMFFQRELIFNVLLAQRRAERGRVEGTREAGQVMQRFLLALPASILSGVDDIDEILEFRNREAQKLREMLYSQDVQHFVEGADEALKSGAALDWTGTSFRKRLFCTTTECILKRMRRNSPRRIALTSGSCERLR